MLSMFCGKKGWIKLLLNVVFACDMISCGGEAGLSLMVEL